MHTIKTHCSQAGAKAQHAICVCVCVFLFVFVEHTRCHFVVASLVLVYFGVADIHSRVGKELLVGLQQKGQHVAQLLEAKRTYMEPVAGGEEEGAFAYDPRYLVFEFTWNILLRKPQVDLVKDIVGALQRGESIVKQMIMGKERKE